jgi:hypothetical protein
MNESEIFDISNLSISEDDFNFSGSEKLDSKKLSEEEKMLEQLLPYQDLEYTSDDRINFIKKIGMYMEDPQLKKICNSKLHLKEYLNKKTLLSLDVKTLNWIYDELKNFSMTESLTELGFNTYLTVNNLIEASLCKFNVNVSGYSESLDNPLNRLLMKQITIDNFNYLSGYISPTNMLLINTSFAITGAYKNNIQFSQNEKINSESEKLESEKLENETNFSDSEKLKEDPSKNEIIF